MKVTYDFDFESEEQREALEAALQRLGIHYRVVGGELLAEEPSAEYQIMPDLSPEDKQRLEKEIQLGLEDVKAGRVVPSEVVEQKLIAFQASLRDGK